MSKKKRKAYTPEFKSEAVRLVREQSYKVSEAARNLGLSREMLSRWIRENKNSGSDVFPGKGNLFPESGELRRLREENKRLRQEREILKKAAAFFAKEST